VLVENALRGGKGGVGGQDPAEDRALEQDLFDLV
jgi:hypothetical protein